MSRQIFRYLFFVLIFYYLPGSAQIQFSQQEALEDLKALKTALEYVHPRLYKYQDEATFNRLFNQKSSALKDQIPGVDLLAIVSQINAQVNCGHLYTIPQLELREELQQRKVFPFFVKVIRNELYISNDCSLNEASSNGAKILSINGHKSSDILSKMKAGIATDGFIESRKDRLIERSLFSLRNGFDLYYFLYLDRSDSFEIELTLAGEKQKTTIKFVAINRDVRKQRLLDLYQINENRWFQNPSPSAEFSVDKNYAVLSLPRSFHNPKIDPPFNDFLKAFFDKLKIDSIHNLILDLRNNEGGSEAQEIELLSYLLAKPCKLYQNIYLSHLDYRPLKEIII
ncbi:MAG: S41 family peptidase, partial [Bacteroidota bacterium]